MITRVCSGHGADDLLSQIDAELASGLKATLALVFCSVEWDVHALSASLVDRGLAVVGATSSGEIANAEILERGCSVMLWEAATDSFSLWSASRAEHETMEGVAHRLGEEAVGRFTNPIVLIFASGIATDGEAVVRGINSGAARDLTLYGGLAGDDMRMVQTHVFANTSMSSDGLVGLVLDGDRYKVQGIAANGWQPVGTSKTVTRSYGNVVHELDGRSVLDVYRDYLDLGDLLSGDGSVSVVVGVPYPLSVERGDGSAVIRAPLFSDAATDSLVFAGAVAEGSQVRFCIPPSLDVVERVVAEATAMHAEFPDADAVLLVSCKARHAALGPIVEDEIEGLNDVWGVPMAGYFSYGEIGSATGSACDFHNETCMLLAIREVNHA